MQRFQDLKVWQRSHALVLRVYQLTKHFPAEERFGVTSQLRRAILSEPTNIAEGSKRRSNPEYAHFLNIAEGSLAEAEYLLMVSGDLTFAAAEKIQPLMDELSKVSRMLHALRAKVVECSR
jgi:four helix bundle protein